MAQTLNYDLDSMGGGFGGGMGGFGGNPLLWLITLGFLKGENGGILGGNGSGAGAGVLAGETQAKLDCLAQQHQTMQHQMANNATDNKFATLGAGIAELAGINRDSTAALTNTLNNMRAESAECCCETKVAIQDVKTDIAMQTSVLLAESKAGTQAILTQLCENQAAIKDAEIRRLQDSLQTQTILANCGGGHGGNNIDINVLARALQTQGQVS